MINDKNRSKFTRRISEVKNILTFQVSNKSEPSLEAKYNNFFDQISMIYNECFPLVTKKIHSKTLSKPWITSEIQSLIKKKNKQFILTTTEEKKCLNLEKGQNKD